MSGHDVYGGSSAASVVTPELDAAAVSMRSAADELDRGVSVLQSGYFQVNAPSLVLELGFLQGVGEAEQAQRLQGQCKVLWDRIQELGTSIAARVEELGQDLSRASTSYADAEARTLRELDTLCRPGEDVLGLAAVKELVTGFRKEDPPGQAVAAEAIATALGLAGKTHSAENGVKAERRAAAVMSAVIAGLRKETGQAGPIRVGQPQKTAQGRVSGLPSLIDLQTTAMKGEDGSGAIVVTKVEAVGAGTEPTWVVTIPGTNTEGDKVWGIGRLPQAIGGDTTHVAAAVTKALDKVGVPEGARVVLNGHSQGGRHALNLSRDAGLNELYTVAGVVTAGAPSGDTPTMDGMPVVQLEDPDDPVPGLDGSTHVTPTRDRFLVRSHSSPASRAEGMSQGLFGPEHKSTNYRALAQEVQDQSKNPELMASLGAMGIGVGGGVAAQTWVVPTEDKKKNPTEDKKKKKRKIEIPPQPPVY